MNSGTVIDERTYSLCNFCVLSGKTLFAQDLLQTIFLFRANMVTSLIRQIRKFCNLFTFLSMFMSAVHHTKKKVNDLGNLLEIISAVNFSCHLNTLFDY